MSALAREFSRVGDGTGHDELAMAQNFCDAPSGAGKVTKRPSHTTLINPALA